MNIDSAYQAAVPMNSRLAARQRVGSNTQMQFGAAVSPEVLPIKHQRFAEGIYRFIEKRPKLQNIVKGEINWGNASINDWLSRVMLFALYISQGVTAARTDQHKYETTGRNAVVWTGTLALNLFVKSDVFGVNRLLNTFMRPKGTPYEYLKSDLDLTKEHRSDSRKKLEKKPTNKAEQKKYKKETKFYNKLTAKEKKLESKLSKLIQSHGGEAAAKKYQGGTLHQLFNKVRLEQNYFDLIKDKHIGINVSKSDYLKTYWASLNSLDIEAVQNRVQSLKNHKVARALTEKEAQELKTLSRFMMQLSTSKFIGTAIMSALTIYFVGTVLMDLVFKYVAPFDHDFDPEKTPQAIRKRIKEENMRVEGKAPEKAEASKPVGQPFAVPHMLKRGGQN